MNAVEDDNVNDNGKDDNANSIVLMLKYDKFSVIFTGDATGDTEAAAINNFGEENLRATVLTASHHGANSEKSNSQDWVDATKPKVVIYSAGKKNAHPKCEVRERYYATLSKTRKHDATCGENIDDKIVYLCFETDSAEYMTRSNGNIVITTNGKSSLRLDCQTGLGCDDIEIPFDAPLSVQSEFLEYHRNLTVIKLIEHAAQARRHHTASLKTASMRSSGNLMKPGQVVEIE